MSAKIDIISGFLGAGKTTLIKKLLADAFKGEQVVLIENEFGEIGIDGGFLKEAGIEIREMNSGCICCSLVGDFGESLKEVMKQFDPARILIEPSGVGKLSDIIKAVQGVQEEVDIVLNSYTTVVDAKKCKMYMRNFGEFFNNQVQYAGAIVLSRTDIISEEKTMEALSLVREINKKAAVITTPIDQLDGKKLLEVMEHPVSLEEELLAEEEVCPECGHVHAPGEHHHHDHEHEHHHDHDDHEHEHEHDHDGHDHEHHHDHDDHDHDYEDHEHEHHHDHDDHDHDHEDHEHEHHHDHDDHDYEHHHDHEDHDHEHHHDHDHHHDHHGHHHHHADEVFTSWGRETVRKYSREEIENILHALSDEALYGIVLRAKGMLQAEDGTWTYFDMVPEETDLREGTPEFTGRFCVIGSKLNEANLAELFHVQ